MRTLKQMLKPILDDFTPAERFSLRFQDGVEIYEHEAVQKFAVSETAEIVPNAPRLVVLENDRAEGGLITRTRSEIAGLSLFLNTAVTAK